MTVLNIVNHIFRIHKVNRKRNLLSNIFILVIILGVIIVARILSPKESGIGTHTELGFPPCTFYVLTKLPCPGCGITTSFSHMTRFQFKKAFQVHPYGPILFTMAILLLIHQCILIFCGYSISFNLSVKTESIILLLLFLGFIAFFIMRCICYHIAK